MQDFRIDDGGFRVGPDCIPWDRVQRVVIRTTADGPWSEDLFWVFVTADAVFEAGHEAMPGDRLATLQRHLPGLDSAAILQAMGTTEHDLFFVYDRLGGRATKHVLRERFNSLVARLGGRADDTSDRLLAAWSDPARAYHDLLHLAECLDVLDRHGSRLHRRDAVELALWFHDAVYDPRADDNEARSEAWLSSFARDAALPLAVAELAAALVRSTAHLAQAPAPSGPEADLIHDIDLAILGADPLRFVAFERGIREEYSHLGRVRFALGRGAFLQGLLAAPAIYRTPELAAIYEAPARANVAATLASRTYTVFRWTQGWRRLLGDRRGAASR